MFFWASASTLWEHVRSVVWTSFSVWHPDVASVDLFRLPGRSGCREHMSLGQNSFEQDYIGNIQGNY